MINSVLISSELSIRQAMAKLDETGKQILLVVEAGRLIGVVTDGDVRRAILAGGGLDESIAHIMNENPITINHEETADAMSIMIRLGVRALPVLDHFGRVVDLMTWEGIVGQKSKRSSIPCDVVIMAGGKGTRLYPYTKILPKPLIPIDEVPIVERIMREFMKYQIQKFFLTVNYRAGMIRSYFDETDLKDAIIYVEEPIPLGTAGSLRLIQNELNRTFMLSNCDILVRANYEDIYRYHQEKQNLITVVSSLKNVVIPYGVLKLGPNEQIEDLIEKPHFDYLVNTGFYIIEPSVLKEIPEGEVFHMTDLIRRVFESGKRVGVYPISEDAWMDMGQITEMKKMIAYFERSDI